MRNLYALGADTLESVPSRTAVVTPSDTAALPVSAKALYVGGAGDINLLAVNDAQPVTLKAVPAGTVLRLWVGAVFATGTTATNLVALI